MASRSTARKRPAVTAPTRTGAPAQSSRSGKARRKQDPPYHHGGLREALLKAAGRILERDGLSGLTLRAVAREAGVSHAAPAHHFRDLTALVSELAAIGYREFGAAMRSAVAPGMSRAEMGLARGRAYVGFARAHPAMYQLMFRAERLDMTNPALHEAANASFAGLAGAVAENRRETIAEEALTLDQAADIVRAWSLVHGFSMLLLDDRLSDILHRLPGGTTIDMLLDAMLGRTANAPERN
jgi:AcrR family transcriptional regulator